MTDEERAEEYADDTRIIDENTRVGDDCISLVQDFEGNTLDIHERIKRAFLDGFNADRWHYPSKGEIPDKDWSKHPANISKECWVVTKRGVGTIARWDNDYRTWFENQPPHLPVTEVIAWQYFVPPRGVDNE